jgi:2-methoxy-6-polyprenyl-1,4-benzoquinol methylase
MGKVLAGDSESYQYLVESIEKFPSQPDFAKLCVSYRREVFMRLTTLRRVQEAGFQTGQMREGKGGAWTDFTLGVATMWTGVKA